MACCAITRGKAWKANMGTIDVSDDKWASRFASNVKSIDYARTGALALRSARALGRAFCRRQNRHTERRPRTAPYEGGRT